MRKAVINIILRLMGKEGLDMMAKLWAMEIMEQETMEEAKAVYARVPRLLKDKVKEILVQAGFEEVVE
jgi:hypothetical protein